MDLSRLEELDKICRNRYAAVLIASKKARNLNLQRLAEEVEPDRKNKVTVQAINELLNGKIKYEYPNTKS